MNEKVIKNPNRSVNAAVKRTPYQPEYERLSKDPSDLYKVNKEDFTLSNKRGKPERVSIGEPTPFIPSGNGGRVTIKAGPNVQGDGGGGHDVDVQLESKFPPQVRVSSGQSEDLTWANTSNFEPEESEQPSFSYDEIPLPPSEMPFPLPEVPVVELETPVSEMPDTEPSFSIADMRPDDYILLHSDSVLKVGSLNEVKMVLSDFILDSNVDIEDFIILKRLNIRAGIFIDE